MSEEDEVVDSDQPALTRRAFSTEIQSFTPHPNELHVLHYACLLHVLRIVQLENLHGPASGAITYGKDGRDV